MKAIYKFYQHFYRMGSIQGVFVSTPEQVAQAIGSRVCFGDVLGKHSDVVIDELLPSHFELLTDDQDFIARAESYNLVPSGRNPFDYMDEE
jgi:hypothetical protein